MTRRAIAALLVLSAACGDDSPTKVCSGFVGDRDAGPEIELLYLDPEGVPTPVTEGARLSLVEAPAFASITAATASMMAW